MLERPPSEEESKPEKLPTTAVPTKQDHANARIRQEIAAKQEREYRECYLLAFGAFGPDWLPSHRHFLIDKEESSRARYTQERPQVAATVYTVRHADGRARHFTVEGGLVKEHASYEAGFGSMLLEPHPTHTIEVLGRRVHPHRYDLCFAPYELYNPKPADQLAVLRATRERKKAEREQKKYEEQNPLFHQAGIRPG